MNNKTGAVILAAGKSDISKTDMLKQELDTLREAGVAPIAVVAGQETEEIRRQLVHRRVVIIENPRYRTTRMFASMKMGLEALRGMCSHALVVNVDTPSFSKETVLALTSSAEDITFPVREGKAGHPFIIDMDVLDTILSYSGRGGIQGMLKKNLLRAGSVEVDDAGIHMEVSELEGLDEALSYQKDILLAKPLEVCLKVSLSRSEEFFDEDISKLLSEIKGCGSMNTACRNLNMAYSRGWKMIKKAEEMLGFALVTKQVGGSMGGGTVLTEDGERILCSYERILKETVAFAKAIAKREFDHTED